MSVAAEPDIVVPVGDILPPRSVTGSRQMARLAGYVSVVVVWQGLSTFLVNPAILPPPLKIAARMVEIARNELLTHFSATLLKAVISLVILYVLGAVVGILMGVSPWAEAFFRNWVTLMMSLPGILIVLVVILVFGLNTVGPIVAVVLVVFPFVTVNLWEGVKAVPHDLVEMARAFGASRRKILRHVVLPALAPFMFTALTYAFALTWKIAMLTELFGSTSGMGYMFRLSFALFSVTSLLAWAMWSFLLFMFLERVILQRQIARFFRWRTGTYD